jgi:Xaa-Pro dipeptidase
MLRLERRRRLFDAMAAHDLDVLVLGRPADVVFATGARQLWTAGSRPFGPACVAVAATGRTHLLSNWDEGVPAEIDHDDLYGLSWNPANLVRSLAGIPGFGPAKRVGTGSLSPGFPRLVKAIAPDAEVVDGTLAIWAARAAKSADEVAAIRKATAIAEAGLAAMVDALRPGVTERELLAVHLERIASLGAPTPPTERVARIEGDLVALDAGAMADGYEGGAGGTWTTSGARVADDRCRGAVDAVVAACRPGATGADLRAVWEAAAGEPMPAAPVVHGLGLGMEPPIVAAGVGDDAVLRAGMVLNVRSQIGAYFEREVVVVGAEP